MDNHLEWWTLPDDGITSDMESLGYEIHKVPESLEELREIEEDPSDENPEYSTEQFSYRKGGHDCLEFVMSEPVTRRIEGIFGKDLIRLKRQGPVVVQFKENSMESHLMRAHPSRDNTVSIFRPLRYAASWYNGLFKVYTSSHHQTPEQFQNSRDKDAHRLVVEPNECLLVKGGIHIELSPHGGAGVIWVAYSDKVMGKDITTSDAPQFMKL